MLSKRSMVLSLCALALSGLGVTSSMAAEQTSMSTAPLSEVAILNGKFPLPRLSSGFDTIQFTNGKYKKDDVTASIDQLRTGVIDGKPAAVAFVTWSTGGTGIWEVLAVYRSGDGDPAQVGLYQLEDRAKVNSIKIENNKVVLDWKRHAPKDSAPNPSVHEVVKLDSQEFKPPAP